jgi:hypothetical protein
MYFRLFIEIVLSVDAPPKPPQATRRRSERLVLSRAAILLRDAVAQLCTILSSALGRLGRSTKRFLLSDLHNNEVSVHFAQPTKLFRQCERAEAPVLGIIRVNIRQAKSFLKLAVRNVCSNQKSKAVSRYAVLKFRFKVMNFWRTVRISYWPQKCELILIGVEPMSKYRHIAGPKSE